MNEKEFDEVYRQYYKVLYYYSYRIVSSPEIAEDILQDVFTEFWFQRAKLDRNKSIKSYLYTMVRNRSLDYMKSSYHKLCSTDYLLDEYLFPVFSTERNIQMHELTKEINFAVQKLPEKCRLVFLMSREKEMKNKEIAIFLKISVKAIEKHITRAISEIRNHLQATGYLSVVILSSFNLLNTLRKLAYIILLS